VGTKNENDRGRERDMSVLEFPDRIERIKSEIAARWRRELFNAGMTVNEADLQHALDLLVPGACQYLAAEAKLIRENT
jgi:hypothetical protein